MEKKWKAAKKELSEQKEDAKQKDKKIRILEADKEALKKKAGGGASGGAPRGPLMRKTPPLAAVVAAAPAAAAAADEEKARELAAVVSQLREEKCRADAAAAEAAVHQKAESAALEDLQERHEKVKKKCIVLQEELAAQQGEAASRHKTEVEAEKRRLRKEFDKAMKKLERDRAEMMAGAAGAATEAGATAPQMAELP